MNAILTLSPYESVAVITAILYVLLAARESIWCWPWGIVSCAFWAYSAYFELQLYVDALLQLFYIAIAVFGWYQWHQGKGATENYPISTMSVRAHLLIIVLGLAATAFFGYFFDNYTDAAATYPDALTTVFSVVATIMVVKKKLENWIYWIVIDIIYIFLYYSRGGYLFAILFVVFVIIAVYGYINWKANYRKALVENRNA